MKIRNSLIASVAALSLMAGTMPAQADPITLGVVGVGVVMGVVGFVIGSASNGGAPAPAPLKYRDDNAAARCAKEYKSYEPNTGLITLNTGYKKICPYLQ
jgi:hypothetical protein